ncbi:MAG: aminotransferase class V-fold PLP-dependent enzyme [Dehalococcoidales bacterium]|nr:aminotransferase class V-fold PLP-dependent enzyme [Dehalococcoidales bacterium]
MTSENSLEWVRKDFPSLENKHNGWLPVYFDNACNTLVPRQVIDAFNDYYMNFPACGEGRSRHWFAAEVTDRIDGNEERGMQGARNSIKEFFNASSHKEIIFTLNSSHGINIVALGMQFKPGDVVLHTDKEHNSNMIPWLRLRKKGIIMNQPIFTTPDGEIDLDMFEEQLKTRHVRLVSMGFTSNLTGYTIPAKEIIQLAHRYGALVLLDGAQAVPHMAIDVQDLDVDFLACSMHKMCGPRGVGVLYGKSEYLGKATREEDEAENVILPTMLGGDTVFDSTYDDYTLLQAPERFEVGLQDYAGQIAAGAAVKYLRKVGMDNIHAHEEKLNTYLSGKLMERYGDLGWFNILGPKDPAKRSGIVSFEVKRPNANGIAEDLSEKRNVMIRDGQFCVHSYLNNTFGVGWSGPQLPSEQRMMYRASFYFYNTIKECDIFLDTLQEIFEERFYV